MHIYINDKTVLKDIQKTFSNYYPFLLLKFYKTPHNKFEDSKYLDELDVDKSIGEINQLPTTIKIDIMPMERVFQFENIFFEKTGISVQVLKLENETWQQTSCLDNLTLKDLNIIGRNSSDDFITKDISDEFETEEEI
jgi:hypothetical protein